MSKGLRLLRDGDASPRNPLVIAGSNIHELPFAIPSCMTCEHRVKGTEECGHPSVAAWEMNWMTARPKLKSGQSVAFTRSDGGGCGPSGRLWQRQSVRNSPVPFQIMSGAAAVGTVAGVLLVSWWCVLGVILTLALFGKSEAQK